MGHQTACDSLRDAVMTKHMLTESTVETAALDWLKAIGGHIAHGPNIAPDMLAAERSKYSEVVLARRLRDALARLNPDLAADALEDVFRRLMRPRCWSPGADIGQAESPAESQATAASAWSGTRRDLARA